MKGWGQRLGCHSEEVAVSSGSHMGRSSLGNVGTYGQGGGRIAGREGD